MSPLDTALANVVERKTFMSPGEIGLMDETACFMRAAASVYGADSDSPEFAAAWLLACSFLSELSNSKEGETREALGEACLHLQMVGLWNKLFGEMDLPPFNEDDRRMTR